MSTHSTSLAAIARRQKRLKDWLKRFDETTLTADQATKIREQLSTFQLLLSKLAKAENEQETKDSEERLSSLERELTSLFEARRLMTSSLGAPAIKDLY